MISRRYSILGWIVWQIAALSAQVAKRRASWAPPASWLVLIGGVLAARESGPDAVKKH